MTEFAKSVEDGVQKTLSGNYSFISSRDELEYYSNYYCGLEVRDDFYENDQSGFVVRRDSDLLKPLNDGLKSLMDDGTYWKLRNKWWKPECINSGSDGLGVFRGILVLSGLITVLLSFI